MVRLFFLIGIAAITLYLSTAYPQIDDTGEINTLDKLRSELRSAPKNEALRLLIAQQYLDAGKKADAIELLRQGTELDANNYELHAKLCPLYLEINQPDKAILHGEQAIRLKPLSAVSYFNAGLAYGKKGLPREALRLFYEAYRIEPDNPEYLYNLGVVYFNLEDYQNAMVYYRKTLEKDPQDARAYFNIGTIYNILGKKEQAIEELRKALDILGPFTPEGERTIEYIEDIRKQP